MQPPTAHRARQPGAVPCGARGNRRRRTYLRSAGEDRGVGVEHVRREVVVLAGEVRRELAAQHKGVPGGEDAQHPAPDLSRVGIYGGSAGGQNALAALLHHGDFYKVAAADCGCHDNRMDKASWNEQWMGYPVGPHYAASSNIDNAHRLRGRLMLIVGELMTVMPLWLYDKGIRSNAMATSGLR